MGKLYTERFDEFISHVPRLISRITGDDLFEAWEAYLILVTPWAEAGTRAGHVWIATFVAGNCGFKTKKSALNDVALDWHRPKSLGGEEGVYDRDHQKWWDAVGSYQGKKPLSQWRAAWLTDGSPAWTMDGRHVPEKEKLTEIAYFVDCLKEAEEKHRNGFFAYGLGWVSVHLKKKDGVIQTHDNGLPKLVSVPESWFVYGHELHAPARLSKPPGFLPPKGIKCVLRGDRTTWDVFMLKEVQNAGNNFVPMTGSSYTQIGAACVLYQVPSWVTLETTQGQSVTIDGGAFKVA